MNERRVDFARDCSQAARGEVEQAYRNGSSWVSYSLSVAQIQAGWRDCTGAFCAFDHGGLVCQFPFELHRLAHLGVLSCLFGLLHGLVTGSITLPDWRRECIPTRAVGASFSSLKVG